MPVIVSESTLLHEALNYFLSFFGGGGGGMFYSKLQHYFDSRAVFTLCGVETGFLNIKINFKLQRNVKSYINMC